MLIFSTTSADYRFHGATHTNPPSKESLLLLPYFAFLALAYISDVFLRTVPFFFLDRYLMSKSFLFIQMPWTIAAGTYVVYEFVFWKLRLLNWSSLVFFYSMIVGLRSAVAAIGTIKSSIFLPLENPPRVLLSFRNGRFKIRFLNPENSFLCGHLLSQKVMSTLDARSAG
jgi:hypothetical protein